ncbi:MAG: putative toxin-antitoxin system toxin component, PIN family [Thermodesulfovibrionales bacterium]|nr:putative toxin-antitoxin system toxin component, PIN family [Thermodesulfovibrionales bacterium]
MPKIVIDANVIVSSLFGGTPRKAFLKALKTCDVYISPEIGQELSGLLTELKSKLGSAKIRRLRSIIVQLVSYAKEVNPSKKLALSRDNKDNTYLNLCLAVRADFLLTGDKYLLEIPIKELKSFCLKRLNIVSPNTFLSLE